MNRLNSLQNGGPVEETDAGTDADDLNSTTGSTNNDTGDDDMTPDDTLSSATDMSGNYLAAAMQPFFVICFLQMEMQWIMRAQTILHPRQIYREMMLQQIPEIQAVHQTEHLRIMILRYIRIPQRMDLVTERRMILIQGKNDTPELSPTPTPILDDRTTYFDPYYRKGDPNITDGDEPFYQKLDADSVPFTGSGTEDDPYVYLCSSAKRES